MSTEEPNLNFCPNCSAKIEYQIPAGDNRLRAVCTQCQSIHYQNPRLVVGTIPVWQSQILLCRRAIEPRLGFWTLPAGFMENGESTAQGAARETDEEAGAHIEMGELFSVIDVPQVRQVHVFYLATVLSPVFNPGEESLEVQLFSEADIPWKDIAFRTVSQTLEWFFEDRKNHTMTVHHTALTYPPRTKS